MKSLRSNPSRIKKDGRIPVETLAECLNEFVMSFFLMESLEEFPKNVNGIQFPKGSLDESLKKKSAGISRGISTEFLEYFSFLDNFMVEAISEDFYKEIPEEILNNFLKNH